MRRPSRDLVICTSLWTAALLLGLIAVQSVQADILREYWRGIQGSSIADLTANPSYPDHPTGSNLLKSFETPTNWANYYGTRVRGYLIAPATGAYVFWIAGDDSGELWLSTDDDPDNASRIAYVAERTAARQWDQYPTQKSGLIELVAGRRYYIEALHKEGSGSDNLAVGWAKPGEDSSAPSEVIPGRVLEPWTGYGPSYNRKPSISVPADYSLEEAPATLQFIAQVQDDGKPLPANPENPDENDPNKLRWSWSVVSEPAAGRGVVWSGNPTGGEAFTYEGSQHSPNTAFVCDPCATFDTPGLYMLEFRASDGGKQIVHHVRVSIRSTSVYRQLGYLYLSPVPFAEYVPAQARLILVRFSEISPFDVTNLATFMTVTGSSSGCHSGQTRIATDDRTVIFAADVDFEPNEVVTVCMAPTIRAGATGSVEPYEYPFVVARHMPDPLVTTARDESVAEQAREVAFDQDVHRVAITAAPAADGAGGRVLSNGVSVPSDFPQPVITVKGDPAPGYIFLENAGQDGSQYMMILDNNGEPVWYRRGEGRGFKVQRNGMITWAAFAGMDKNFNWVRDYSAANGHSTDDHDLEVLEDGSYLLLGFHDQSGVDVSRYLAGGHPNATVHATTLQEFTAAGELIFQFRSWDHFDIADVEPVAEDPRGGNVRFAHMNAIDVDEDGHLLISSRHVSEVTKINRDTGRIIWRLGGAHSDFTFVNDPLNGFYSQHDISALGNGRYLLFDNGNSHSPPVSRAVEYQLDLEAMTATLVWEFRDTPDRFALYMGNAQRLPNGNTLINFVLAGYPKVTEVDSNGVKQFEMNLQPGSDLYQACRFPWDGVVAQPYLVAEAHESSVTLIFNKFGDRHVATYRVYGGTSPQPMTLLLETPSTLAHLTDLQNQRRYYFRVTAVDANGAESAFSNEETLFVNFQNQPGAELIRNGDFSQGQEGWTWELKGAAAEWTVSNGVSSIAITNGGTTFDAIQLHQAGICLSQGRQYTLAFDLWGTGTRVVEIEVKQGRSPYTNYSRIGYTAVSPQKKHHSLDFTMTAPTDADARIVINAGLSKVGVSLDNVSLKQK